jgi:PKD repeat protein
VPSQPIANGTTIFNASASTVGWNGTSYPSITSYKWTFGDGNVTTLATPIIRHVYTHNNTYTVTLTITDATGKLNVTSTTIKVIALARGYSVKVSVKLVPCTPAHNVYKGWTVNVTALVKNNGTFTETNFGVTAYCNTTILGTQTVTSLAPGANTTLIFTWSTTQFAYGNYTIEIQILSPPATAFFNVKVKGVGDVNGDGVVNWVDLGLLGLAYNSTPLSSNWNPECDFNADGVVNWIDFGLLGLAYNQSYPY